MANRRTRAKRAAAKRLLLEQERRDAAIALKVREIVRSNLANPRPETTSYAFRLNSRPACKARPRIAGPFIR